MGHDWAAAVNAGSIVTSAIIPTAWWPRKALAVNLDRFEVSGSLGHNRRLGQLDLGDFSDYLGLFGDLLGDGLLPGKIETGGYYAHGMVARNWSAAINLDRIVTQGNDSYGMLAEDYSLALNGQGQTGGFCGSHGMFASNWSAGVNLGEVNTTRWPSRMYAENHSSA